MDWNDIIKTVTTNAIFMTVLGFVAKSIFIQFLSRDIENHKTKLQVAHDIELEKLKFDLNKLTSGHQIMFSRLHETRAEVIAKLYELLVEAEATYAGLASDYVFTKKADTDKDAFKDVDQKWTNLGHYFSRRRIYFDDAFCKRMGQLLSAYISGGLLYLSLENNPNEESKQKDFLEIARNEIPKIKQDMEHDFRHLLGIQG